MNTKTHLYKLYEELIHTIISNPLAVNDLEKKYLSFHRKLVKYCTFYDDIFVVFRFLKELEADIELRMACLPEDTSRITRHRFNRLANTFGTELSIIELKIAHPGKDYHSLPQDIIPKLLKWTASKVALVELIYSLRKCVNHGKATIKDIAACLQFIFQIDLGNYYDMLDNINLRQKDQAKFLHTLIDNLYEELDKLNHK